MSERYRCCAHRECRAARARCIDVSTRQSLFSQRSAWAYPRRRVCTRKTIPESAAAAAVPIATRGESVLHIAGDAAALEVEVRQARIMDVLTALAGFNIRYRSSIAPDETLDGAYTGSLGRVLSRVLDGYDYAIKQDNAKFEVIVVGKRGEQADSAPIIKPVRQRPSE